MVNSTAYKIIKKAIIIRINKGEDGKIIIAEYSKLSEQQQQQMLQELIAEGYIVE